MNGNFPIINEFGGGQVPYHGGGFGGGGGFNQPQQFFNWQTPQSYNPSGEFYYWNPQATQTQNLAFNIPDYQKNKALLESGRQEWEGYSLGDISPLRGQQIEFLDTLKAQAYGEAGTSVAERLFRSGQEANIQQTMALQASTPARVDPALTNYYTQQQQAQTSQQAANQASLLRSAEMAQAQAAYGGSLENIRDQDLATRRFQEEMVTYYLSQGLNLNQAQASSNQALESLLSGQYQAAQALAAQQAIANEANKTATKNAWIGAGATLLGALAGAVGGGGIPGGSTSGPFGGPHPYEPVLYP